MSRDITSSCRNLQNAAHTKQEEPDGSEYDPENTKDSKRDGGADPEILAPDLLAACKANDEGCAQDLLADGVAPGYSDPESGMLSSLLMPLNLLPLLLISFLAGRLYGIWRDRAPSQVEK